MARKKKSGAAKNKEKQKAHQSRVQAGAAANVELTKLPANGEMKCDKCERAQKNRAFCYFCGTLQRLPQCVHCGRQKCMSMGGGDCLVKHIGSSATGMAFIGAICDFCEGWVCHSRRCIQKHSCPCPLDGAACIECTRTIANYGGRFWQCGTCHGWLCDDDQFEHQASCTVLQTEKYQCGSCNRFGTWSCLKCKICFCDTHRAGNIPQPKGEPPKCKKCQNPLSVTKDLAISTKSHKYGRGSQARVKKTVDEDAGAAAASAAGAGGAGAGADDKGSDADHDDADRDDSDRYAAFMNRKNTGTHDYLNLARDLAPDNKSAANRWQSASYSDDEDADAQANSKRMDGDDDDYPDDDDGEGDEDDDDGDGGEGDDDADADGDAADRKTTKSAAAAAAAGGGASAKAAARAGAGAAAAAAAGAAKPKAGAKADAKQQPPAQGKSAAADAKAKPTPAPAAAAPAAAPAAGAAAPKAAAVALESLPPTAMSLDATKKLLFSRKPFNPDFWKSFWPSYDAAGWSFHTAVYAYDSENSLLFKTNNLVSGWLQRSDECRRYALGVVHVSGADEDNGPFHVASCWLFRGADVIPQMRAVDDAAYFTWTKVDVTTAAGKALVESHFTGPKPPNSSANPKLTLLDRRYLK